MREPGIESSSPDSGPQHLPGCSSKVRLIKWQPFVSRSPASSLPFRSKSDPASGPCSAHRVLLDIPAGRGSSFDPQNTPSFSINAWTADSKNHAGCKLQVHIMAFPLSRMWFWVSSWILSLSCCSLTPDVKLTSAPNSRILNLLEIHIHLCTWYSCLWLVFFPMSRMFMQKGN